MKLDTKHIVYFFAGLKLLIHFFTNTNYTFHRDEFLYLDEGNHLAWGFLEVPPMTPFLGKVFTTIFGDSVFGVRMLPALVGVIMVFLIARIAKELGGGKWALILSLTAFLLSPAFLRTNTLFQPVCLDQLIWVITILISILIVKYNRRRDYYLLGIAIGLGWLTKYSIAFIVLALLLGVLVTTQRKVLSIKTLAWTIGIAVIIAIPNLFWQYTHNFPIVQHMDELARTQLVHVNPGDFIFSQLLMQFMGLLIWIPGVIWLLFSKTAAPYRFLGWTYVFLIGLMLALSGKDYYTLGIYPVLVAAGGVAIEQWLNERTILKSALLGFVVVMNLLILPMGLPVLNVEQMVEYCKVLDRIGIEQRWEDGEKYPIPQDYADMRAWEEPVATVARHYHALPKEKQETCLIYGGSYAHAGPLNYYRKKYNLPVAQSLQATYVLWVPDTLKFDNMFLVDDTWQDSTALFYNQVLIDSTRDVYARDPGYVYYRSDPRPGMDSMVVEIVRGAKERFIRR